MIIMKHIAYITSEYPHTNTPPAGGIGTFIKNMALRLTDLGINVTIFLCLAKEDLVWHENKIKIVQIKEVKSKIVPSFILSRIKINRVIQSHIKKYQIDLVEAPDWEGLHAFCNFKVPLITRTHGSMTYFSFITKNRLSKIVNFLEKKGVKNSDYVIGVSKYSAKKTAELFNLSSDIKTIYYGTDLSKFKPLSHESIKEPPILLHFGSLVRKKGVLDIPYMFNKINEVYPKCKLLILGKDTIDSVEKKSTWNLMKQSFTKTALQKTSYLGPVRLEEVQKHLADATACVFTSYAETFGLVTTESMAMKKPVIIYDFPWVREIIENGKDGILIKPGKHEKNAQIISKILDQKNNITSIGKQARKKIENKFDLTKKVKENLDYYNKIINAK